ncbi:MAG TPA: ATP-binding cassette domain-containing protein [Acidimicrobiales bacterium]|jgi:ABC-2 type transport system ATP-binding protein
MPDNNSAIEIRGLTKRFGALTAVDHLTFDVPAGNVVGFLGSNGAGKTTTLRMLLGLVAPSAGQATFRGRLYADLADPLHEVGAVLEAANFHPGRTARAHLDIYALAGDSPRSRVDDVLDQVGLTSAAERRVGGFSMGMRQRLGLATALLHNPEIFILDEPSNGLDPEGVRWLRDLIKGLAADGHTVLVSSHLLAEVAQTVDSVVIVDHGHLVTQSSLAKLTAQAGMVVRIRTPRAAELATALARDGITATVVASDRLEVSGATPEQVGTLAAERAIPLFETTTDAPSLEDVFLHLTTTHQEVSS